MLCSLCRNHHIKNSRERRWLYLSNETHRLPFDEETVQFSKRNGNRKKSATHPVALPKHAQA